MFKINFKSEEIFLSSHYSLRGKMIIKINDSDEVSDYDIKIDPGQRNIPYKFTNKDNRSDKTAYLILRREQQPSTASKTAKYHQSFTKIDFFFHDVQLDDGYVYIEKFNYLYIIIPIVVVLIIAGVIITICCCKKKKKEGSEDYGMDDRINMNKEQNSLKTPTSNQNQRFPQPMYVENNPLPYPPSNYSQGDGHKNALGSNPSQKGSHDVNMPTQVNGNDFRTIERSPQGFDNNPVGQFGDNGIKK